MGHYAFLFANTALIFSCVSMAVVFLIVPLPSNEGIRKYRFSLRFLSSAYLTLAIIIIFSTLFHLQVVNLISMKTLTIASLQASMFTFALITLINPAYITKHYLYWRLLPVNIFAFAYFIVSINWGDPEIASYHALKLNAFQPSVIIRELLLLYYIFQLIQLTREFKQQLYKYEKEINNYFADNLQLQLPWIRYCFYAALSVGIGVILSCFVVTEQLLFMFSIAYTGFYMLFGFYYIQYPSIFVRIEPALYPPPATPENGAKTTKRLVWSELKNQIIANKYYLKAGITIEEMAHYLKIGRTTLSSFINKEEQKNFNLWINSLRIEEAKQLLLEHPDYSLTEIAEQVGYSEPSNFSRQFKIITSESPSVWRQTHLA